MRIEEAPAMRALGERLASGGAQLLDWMLPPVCVLCEQLVPGSARECAPRGWCAACAQALPGRDAPRCPVCGERSAGREPRRRSCRACRDNPPAFTRSLVLADYAPPLDHLVQAIKFGRRSALAAPLGRLLAGLVARTLAEEPALRPAFVTAVPLAHERLARRGFNQSLLLAAPVARALALPARASLLRRVRQGPPASSLDAGARREALAGAFVAKPLPQGATVLVVDDVMTTGATLEAAAQALRRAGAGIVIACVAARTP